MFVMVFLLGGGGGGGVLSGEVQEMVGNGLDANYNGFTFLQEI